MMEIMRTSNAGILLNMDNTSILLDGVSKEIYPYSKTPDDIKQMLCENFPDIILFTHCHEDHYDSEYADLYNEKTLRSVNGPELSFSGKIGNIEITSFETKHIGKADVKHISYIISGSKCVWFLGDASPLCFKKIPPYRKPDILVVPYAYAITESAWKITKNLSPENVVLLHLPEKDKDIYNLWDEVERITNNSSDLHIPEIGKSITF